MRVAELAGIEVTPLMRDCLDAIRSDAPADYREIAAIVATTWRSVPHKVFGLSGGQGAGKSTLAALLESAFAFHDVRMQTLSLDDFYLTLNERKDLARRVHPLFETRGAPGTHDVEMCSRTIDALVGGGTGERPVFDKGLDDRVGSETVGPADLVLLEGWCVGAQPASEADLTTPVNPLEAEEDADCAWRRSVNDQLEGSYAALWRKISALIYLSVPDLGAVRSWREQQERSLPADRQMNKTEIARFVQHYERVTVAMRDTLPPSAAGHVSLGQDHRVDGFRLDLV